jgi:hypothetical protein
MNKDEVRVFLGTKRFQADDIVFVIDEWHSIQESGVGDMNMSFKNIEISWFEDNWVEIFENKGEDSE